jgi:hypothetical protein
MRRNKNLNAWIPDSAIGIADAFEILCERCNPEWNDIQAEKQIADDEFASKNVVYLKRSPDEALDETQDGDFSTQQKEVLSIAERRNAISKRENEAKNRASRILRQALAVGKLAARIADSDAEHGSRQIRKKLEKWIVPSEADNPDNLDLGFRDNFVEEWQPGSLIPEQPGPRCCSANGTLQPVFVFETDFNAWLFNEGYNREGPPGDAFTAYPQLPDLTEKPLAALEIMKLIWRPGSPNNLSAKSIANRVSAEYQARGRQFQKTDGRGKPIHKFTEDDIKRALDRK